ncbi:P-loop containing nucleoside triphosphate hydrolase protein [Martensiomyces pterosporus]|nr:P-loop containing nucleoside triphosphate hydrolase protein [Martensiomyces pterosporus]
MEFSSSSSRHRSRSNGDDDAQAKDTKPAYIDPFARIPSIASSSTQNSTQNTPGSSADIRSKSSKGPLSVEEALRLKSQQQSESAKPVFLTKSQRAQLALERKQREADEARRQREIEVQALRARQNAEDGEDLGDLAHGGPSRRSKRAERSRSRSPERGGGKRGRGRYYDRDSDRHYDRGGDEDDRHYRPGPRSRESDRYYRRPRSRSPSRRAHNGEREKKGDGDPQFTYIGRQSTDGTGDRVLTDKERELIKQRYLVGDQVTGRPRKQNSRKVAFDWDASEDTSRDASDLYENRHELQLLGRGHIAGVDIGEQDKWRSGVYARDSMSSDSLSAADRERMERVHEKKKMREKKAKWDERHWREKPLGEMRERDWRIFKEDYSIACKGGSIPNPYRSWTESKIPKPILRAIEDIGYREPTPIQRQAIPIGLQNRDLIGIAETGSGKTASFLIPMLAFIMTRPMLDESNMADGPYALILAPTRELAQQIEVETQKFARRLGFKSVSIVGGHDIEQQAFALRSGAEIIIATPGRLRDCIDKRILVLNQCTYVVMDEADRMIDMGFEEDVNFILDALPVSNLKPEDGSEEGLAQSGEFKYRQTTMFSATMPPLVERLARRYLRRPATVTIGTAGKAVDTVEQRVEFVVGDEKRKHRLMEILDRHAESPPIIVFVNQKKNVDLLGKALSKTHYSVVTLHGGKSQEQREQSLAKLKNREADILVATDVAGRGIDVKDVSLVVNFDMAKDIESYTHRIGRTGRAGKRGLAVTFLSAVDDRDVLYDLKKMIIASSLSRCPHELANHEAAQAPPSLMRPARKQH